jgi:hypothetical protein
VKQSLVRNTLLTKIKEELVVLEVEDAMFVVADDHKINKM